jgi:ABC-type branched-subunit amino acid transport system ATPase component
MGRKENWLDETLFETLRKIRSFGVTVLLVEQNLWDSLEIADRYYLIASGRIVSTDVPGKLREKSSAKPIWVCDGRRQPSFGSLRSLALVDDDRG